MCEQSMSLTSAMVAAVMIALAGAIAWAGYARTRRSTRALKERQELLPTEIINQFYSDGAWDADSVIDLWNEVAAAVGVPPGVLRPSDRFGEELSPSVITSESLDALYYKASERARRQGGVRLEAILTVDDYIRTFALRKSRPDV
jgi:hypothetical protein